MPRIAGVVSASLALFVFALHAPPAPASAPLPPPEAFGTLPAESDVVLSPDGHWLAWMDHKEAKPRVVMFDVPGRKVQRILAVPERTKLRSLAWNDNSTLLIVVSETRESKYSTELSGEYFQTVAQDVTGGDGRMLPTNDVFFGADHRTKISPRASLLAYRTLKPHTVIMSIYGGCRRAYANCLLEVDTHTGAATVVKVGNQHTGGWVVDRAGKPVAREDWDWHHHAYRVYTLLEDDGIKEILRKDDNERPTLVGLLPDATALVLLASNGRSHRAAWALPLDGSPLRLIADDPNADITNVFADAYTGAIVGVYVSGSTTDVRWLDPAAQHRQEVLQRSFGSRHVDVYGWTEDGTKTLAVAETPSSPPIYYLVDFATHRAETAAEAYPALAGVPLGEVKEITYKARDGTEIPAYLTTPAGKSAAPAPLVVLPHGGPQSRDYFEFDWLVQFLASRGYAVLQPQFRGSIGFGDVFRDAGFRQWGGLMQDDVTDGVRAMIDQGVADPHRIGIVGASYGGYAALAGAAFTPDLYACAASISGVSDLPALMREEVPIYDGAISASLSEWKTRIGAPNDPNLDAKSPINYVKSIKIPILIAYGTGDGVVPNAQSEKMAHALSVAGKNVTVTILKGEDHWLSRSDTRIQVLKGLESFLRDHI